MEIKHIHSVTHLSAEDPNLLEIIMRVVEGGEVDDQTTYTYHPDDPYGGEVHATLTQWLAMNPDFPIAPYEPPEEESGEPGEPEEPEGVEEED